MGKPDVTYTIRYSKNGFFQYADFKYSDGELVYHSFRPKYAALNTIPSIKGLTEIADILAKIQEWAFGQKAEIALINGKLPTYSSQKAVKNAKEKFDSFFNSICLEYTKTEIVPILKKNSWFISTSFYGRFILVEQTETGWANVDEQHPDMILISFICNEFLHILPKHDTMLKLHYEHTFKDGGSINDFLGSFCVTGLAVYKDRESLEDLGYHK